ncbi:MAG: hypothetical protein AAGI68_01775 [Planctomycetota bacterium]
MPADIPHPAAPEAVLWADADHVATLSDTLDLMGAAVRPLAVAGPPSTELDRLARRLDLPVLDDLRKLVIDHPAACLVLADSRNLPPGPLANAAQQGTALLTLEPPAADLAALDATLQPQGPGKPPLAADSPFAFGPAFTESPGFVAAADPADALQEPRLLQITSLGRPQHGSLFARLFDAFAAALTLISPPETLHAYATAPDAAPAPPPDNLRALTGSLSAHARLPGGATLDLLASNAAAHTHRQLTALAPDAHLHLTDTRYSLHQPDGTLLEQSPPEAAESPEAMPYPDLLAYHWRRLLDRQHLAEHTPNATRHRHALACCLACLLSARTGQPESPTRLLDLQS